MTGTPGWAWAAAVGVILGLLAVDLAMSRGAARPHDLHTGCAGPAPHPGLLEASTRQVATEDERQDATPAADATARPAVTAVAK